MPIEILMPALSPTMTEGNLVKWHVKEGDTIKAGKVIAEIETDKATMEVEAVDEGVLGKVVVPAGTESVKVNQLIALLLGEGEDKKALEGYRVSGAGFQVSKKEQQKHPVESSIATVVAASSDTRHPTPDTRVIASPLAKRIAQQEGVDLRSIQGTGPGGRIVKADVEGAGAGAGRSGAVRRSALEFTKIPNTMMRKVIAKRLTESKQTVPHFYLTVECVLDALLQVREDLNAEAASFTLPLQGGGQGGGQKAGGGQPAYKLSVNDFIIKASALALKKIPAANASWTDEAILQYANVDISVAVATPGGLITPIVKNADQKSVIAISKEMKDLAARARDNKLKPEEFQGGGFSISNLGMYGIKQFAAIVNPPQGCILAVGAGEKRVRVKEDGSFEAATVMDVTLSVDHRVVDGAVGAEFLAAFKRYIEHPALVLV